MRAAAEERESDGTAAQAATTATDDGSSSPIDEAQFGAPPWSGDGEDPLSNEVLLQIVLSAIPDDEVNRLVWEALG